MSQGDTKGIISKIANDQDNAVKIKKTKIGNDCYKPWSNTVNYNPQSGLATVDDEGNFTGGRQSPALGLLHELRHAFVDLYFPRKEKQALHTPDDRYDFKSER